MRMRMPAQLVPMLHERVIVGSVVFSRLTGDAYVVVRKGEYTCSIRSRNDDSLDSFHHDIFDALFRS